MARLLVEVTRGDRVESRHRGSIVVISPSGEMISSVGDPEELVFVRSAAKPFQLAPFVASGRFDGYDLPNPVEALAVMSGSHSGEDRHVRTVQAILRGGGLTRDVLACGTAVPTDSDTAERLIRDGEPPTAMRHNCSGKHAGMALHAKAAGWPIETYWQPDHPVQRLALESMAMMTDTPAAEVVTATDGCGAVTFAVSLRGLALAFARLADPSSVPDSSMRDAFRRIRDAMIAHPELVGGDRHEFDTALMRAAPDRLVSKWGAEGVQGVGMLASARRESSAPAGLALKIEDGDRSRRARQVASCEALRQLGVLDVSALDRLEEYAAPQFVDPRGDLSGSVRPAFQLTE
ncbi:MAG: asparaginase [Chloroflexota bacterium]